MNESVDYVSTPVCGELREFQDGSETWLVVCIQVPAHKGPHSGQIMWPLDIGEPIE